MVPRSHKNPQGRYPAPQEGHGPPARQSTEKDRPALPADYLFINNHLGPCATRGFSPWSSPSSSPSPSYQSPRKLFLTPLSLLLIRLSFRPRLVP